ncbi:hypothetical protein Elgi_38270 [Paenibacillus elgii]|uniref:hypothetical protein n=1 Tax=Paenibacillus elgii TaxID=189691 RepID=UPI002D7DD4D8|nr:hypothetical protein Elgi_38270 [Paenibacillus elgii]
MLSVNTSLGAQSLRQWSIREFENFIILNMHRDWVDHIEKSGGIHWADFDGYKIIRRLTFNCDRACLTNGDLFVKCKISYIGGYDDTALLRDVFDNNKKFVIWTKKMEELGLIYDGVEHYKKSRREYNDFIRAKYKI